MMVSNTLFLQISFFMTVITMISQRQHLLMALLSLEGMLLSLVILLPYSTTEINMSMSTMSIILLTFGACEASLGLSLLVNMSRTYGTDMLSALSMTKC